jgi:hypothetical protein
MRRRSILPFVYPCLFVMFIAHLVASTPQLNFAAPVRYSPGGNGPNGIAIGDVNGDGKRPTSRAESTAPMSQSVI